MNLCVSQITDTLGRKGVETYCNLQDDGATISKAYDTDHLILTTALNFQETILEEQQFVNII